MKKYYIEKKDEEERKENKDIETGRWKKDRRSNKK